MIRQTFGAYGFTPQGTLLVVVPVRSGKTASADTIVTMLREWFGKPCLMLSGSEEESLAMFAACASLLGVESRYQYSDSESLSELTYENADEARVHGVRAEVAIYLAAASYDADSTKLVFLFTDAGFAEAVLNTAHPDPKQGSESSDPALLRGNLKSFGFLVLDDTDTTLNLVFQGRFDPVPAF